MRNHHAALFLSSQVGIGDCGLRWGFRRLWVQAQCLNGLLRVRPVAPTWLDNLKAGMIQSYPHLIEQGRIRRCRQPEHRQQRPIIPSQGLTINAIRAARMTNALKTHREGRRLEPNSQYIETRQLNGRYLSREGAAFARIHRAETSQLAFTVRWWMIPNPTDSFWVVGEPDHEFRP